MRSDLTDPWSDRQLLETAANYAGAGSDADQPDGVRFVRGVAQLVKKRLRRGGDVAPRPAVFLLCPAEPEAVDRGLLQSHPMLDNGLTPVEGSLWLVSPVVVSGKCLPLDTYEDAGLFEFVVDGLKQGNVPAVIYDPRDDPTRIRYYATGLESADSCEVIDIPTTELVDIQRILAVVDRLCEKQLVTPDAQSQVAKLWEDADRHWVAKNAELTVQMYLVTALNSAFPTCIVRWEQPQATGRLDIEIEEPDYARPGHVIRHALLELKVLRSFGSTGIAVSPSEVRNWVSKGVDQAYSYREERQTLQSALCCFDMRSSHADLSAFASVAEKAKTLQVTIRRWLLFGSAEAYRSFVSASAQVS